MSIIEKKIIKYFGDEEVEFLEIDGKFWLTAKTLGIILGYKTPRESIMKIYYRHKDELEEYSAIVTLGMAGKPVKTRVFDEDGSKLITMFSGQPKGKSVRKWILLVMREIKDKGYYIEDKGTNGLLGLVLEMRGRIERLEKNEKKYEKLLLEVKKNPRKRIKKTLTLNLYRIDNVLEFFKKNDALTTKRCVSRRRPEDVGKMVVLQSFVNAYDKWARKHGHDLLKNMKTLGLLQSRLLNREICPRMISFKDTNDMGGQSPRAWGILFYREELEKILVNKKSKRDEANASH